MNNWSLPPITLLPPDHKIYHTEVFYALEFFQEASIPQRSYFDSKEEGVASCREQLTINILRAHIYAYVYLLGWYSQKIHKDAFRWFIRYFHWFHYNKVHEQSGKVKFQITGGAYSLKNYF